MTKLELKNRLLQFDGRYGSITSSSTVGSKYWDIVCVLRQHTLFYNYELNIPEMIHVILSDITESKCCGCGCGGVISPKKSFLPKHHLRTKSNIAKIKQTCIDRYGVDNASKSDQIKQRKRETSIKNWGDTSFMKTDVGKAHHKQCMIDKHGVENPFQMDHVKTIIHNKWVMNRESILTKRVNTGRVNFLRKLKDRLIDINIVMLFDVDEYSGVKNTTKYEFRCTSCGSNFYSDIDNGKLPRCVICNPHINMRGISEIEITLREFINITLDISTISGDRMIISPLELDIVSPNNSIAIELNGNYWHSDLNGKDRNYHLNKTNMCAEKGYQLIHIFEDEWLYKQSIVKSRLKHILGKTPYSIYARKCEVREIDSKTSSKFLEKYHIQGRDRASIQLGLFYRDRLVAVMTFSKRRFDNKDGFELVRYCTVGNFNVLGGAGKLLKHFERNWNPTSIISYADKRWSTGGLYKALGFEHTHDSPPNYFYMENNDINRISRHQFQKHKQSNKLQIFDVTLSEWSNMKINNYDRIWDCGNMVFEKHI